MSDGRFLYSLPGRLMRMTLALALASAGGIAVVGPSPASFGLIALAITVCVVSGLFAILLATENFALHAIVMFVPTTILTATYVAFLMVLPHAGKPAGIVLLALSLVPILVTLGLPHGPHGASSPSQPSAARLDDALHSQS
jgi:hypothetical protein